MHLIYSTNSIKQSVISACKMNNFRSCVCDNVKLDMHMPSQISIHNEFINHYNIVKMNQNPE